MRVASMSALSAGRRTNNFRTRCRHDCLRPVLGRPIHDGVPMSLTLHYHPLSSFCWKALVALYENGAPFTPHMVNLGDPAERAALLALWPIGRFPVLRDETRGETVPESSIVIEYLDRHYPGAVKLIPDHPDLALQTRLRD